MPHIIVKLWPGKTEQQKQRLTEAIAKDVREIFGTPDPYITVAFEEISEAEWSKKVYTPDILHGPGTLYKKPGYTA